MERQPYFVQLYNLHLSGEIPPTPVEKQALAKVVYWHCNFNPLAPSDGNSYPPTGAISVRNGDSQVALFKITQDNLQYCHPEYPATPYDTSKEPLKDWWQEDYQSFINEYKHLRAFVDGYIEGEIQQKISEVENGRRDLRFQEAVRIATFLKVSLDELAGLKN